MYNYNYTSWNVFFQKWYCFSFNYKRKLKLWLQANIMLDCTRGKYCLDIYLNIYINEEKINSTVTVIVFALVYANVYKTDKITYYTKLPNDVTLRFVRKMVSIHLTAFTFSFSLCVCGRRWLREVCGKPNNKLLQCFYVTCYSLIIMISY